MRTTTKKTKVIGTETYVNTSTGEIEEMQVVSTEERDFNFHKVWMKSLISTLSLVGNQKTKLAYWIIENLNKENMLTCTYRQISDKTNISLETVRVTMNVLLTEPIDANNKDTFLKKVNNGCYIVNPNIIYKGTRKGRLNVLHQFRNAEQVEKEEVDLDIKLHNLEQLLETINEQIKKVKEEINEQGQTSTDTLDDAV